MHMYRWSGRDDVPVVFWHALGTWGADFARGKTIAGAGFYVLAVRVEQGI
jgi:hypothetical protein